MKRHIVIFLLVYRMERTEADLIIVNDYRGCSCIIYAEALLYLSSL
jgi:hypothetical protein